MQPSNIGDQNIERLLGAYKPENPDPEFVRQLSARMQAAAQELAARAPAPQPRPGWRTIRRRVGWALTAAAALIGLPVALKLLDVATGPTRAPQVTLVNEPIFLPPGSVHGVAWNGKGTEGLTPLPRPETPQETPIAIGADLATKAGECRRVTLADGSVLFLNADTQVQYLAEREVWLCRGEVYVEVAPRTDGTAKATFLLHAPGREVTALGTRFRVWAASGKSGVAVTQGAVQVAGLASLVQAGQELAPGALAAQPAPRATHALEWARELMLAAESPLVPQSDKAGGALLAVDPSGQEARMSLRKYHVDVHIEDGFARTTIDQTYFNETHSRLEGTFYFPLPADAQLSRLAMYVKQGGICRLMEGGMAERDHARAVFETILHTRRDPALLEWVDGTTFKMRVFPLEPREEKRLILSYTQKLPSLYEVTRYRFPAGHTLRTVGQWSFEARVKNGAKLVCTSASHAGMEIRPDQGDMVLKASARPAILAGDVTLEMRPAAKQAQADDRAHFSSFALDGAEYLMLRYRPELTGASRAERRDWVILYESSRDRDPLLARTQVDIVRHLLAAAGHADTFTLVAAGTRVHAFDAKARPVTADNIGEAVKFLEGMQLIGALDLGQALAAVEPMLASAQNPHLLHVGSGVAVIGERGDAVLAKKIPTGAKYIGVGVGKRYARSFMKLAAERSGGYFTQINPDEPANWRALDLLATLNTPRLQGVRIVADNETLAFLADSTAICQGEEICGVARAVPASGEALPKSVTVSGSLDGKAFVKTFSVERVKGGAGHLPRQWAKLELDRLLAEDATENRSKIVALSMQAYVMTPYTSLLVLETEEDYAKFKVDRGRKDHWAMYSCPPQIPVVHEPAVAEKKEKGKSEVENVLASILVRRSLAGDFAYGTVALTPEPAAAWRAPLKTYPFECKNKSWAEALDYLKDLTGLPLATTYRPTGSITFEPETLPNGKKKQYTVPEIFDVLNEKLMVQKFMLIRRAATFTVWPADELIPPELIPFLDLEELFNRGKTEVVKINYPLKTLNPDTLAPAIAKMKGPFGQVIVIDEANRLILIDTVQNIRGIIKMIEDMDGGGFPRSFMFNYTAKYIRAGIAAEMVRKLLGGPAIKTPSDVGSARPLADVGFPQPGRVGGKGGMAGAAALHSNAPLGAVFGPNVIFSGAGGFSLSPLAKAMKERQPMTVTHDDRLNQITVAGPPSRVALAEALVKSLDLAEMKPGVRRSIGPPDFMTFTVPAGDAQIVARCLQAIYQASTTMSINDIGNGRILVYGCPQDLSDIQLLLGSSGSSSVDYPKLLGLLNLQNGGIWVDGPPGLKWFTVPAGDADLVAKNLQTIYKASTTTSISPIGDYRVLVYALPQDLNDISLLLTYLCSPCGGTTKITLDYTNVTAAKVALEMLYSETVNARDLIFDLDKVNNALLVKGTGRQVADVKRAIGAIEGNGGTDLLGDLGRMFNGFGGTGSRLDPRPMSREQVSFDWLTQFTEPTSFRFSRPTMVAPPWFFGDLVQYAPGMHTNAADVLATLEAEVSPDPARKPGKVEPAARELIDRARATGWQKVKVADLDRQPEFTIYFSAGGQFTYERVLPTGLRETVICDGKTLWHLYPEIGLGASRCASRFHLVELMAAIPWLLPDPDELARGADVLLLLPNVVSICPRSAEKVLDENKQPSPYVQVNLVFAESGRLAEKHTLLMPGNTLIEKQLYAANGTVTVEEPLKKAARIKVSIPVEAASAPSLKPDLGELVIVPMPLRTAAYLQTKHKLHPDLTVMPPNLADDAFAQLVATASAMQDGARVVDLVSQRYCSVGEKRPGLFVLARAAGHSINPESNTLPDFRETPLVKYLYHPFEMEKGDKPRPIGKFPGSEDGLVQRLTTFHDLYGFWKHEAATALTFERGQARQRTLDFIGKSPSPTYDWALVDAMLACGKTDGDSKIRGALAVLRKSLGDESELVYAARYAWGLELIAAGKEAEGREELGKLYMERLKLGGVPPIDAAFHQALLPKTGQGNAYAELMRNAAALLIKDDRHLDVLAVAWQAHQLGDTAIANELFDKCLSASHPGTERNLARASAAVYFMKSKQLTRAEAALQPLLDEAPFKHWPAFWRWAEAIASERQQVGRGVQCLEKALELEFKGGSPVVDLATVRGDYGRLLMQYDNAAQGLAVAGQSPTTPFLGKVIRTADRWRALDTDSTAACQLAARVLQKCGQTEMAWDYLTTPLGQRPNEAAPWLALAKTLQGDSALDLADKAFAQAYDAEPTNAQILWDRAQNLEQMGKREEAKGVFQALAAGTWQPRFQGLQEQARLLAK
jgi:ferric-dicitrate binding protein FerR (iron transport regulator)/predicted Zn-dependent protease